MQRSAVPNSSHAPAGLPATALDPCAARFPASSPPLPTPRARRAQHQNMLCAVDVERRGVEDVEVLEHLRQARRRLQRARTTDPRRPRPRRPPPTSLGHLLAARRGGRRRPTSRPARGRAPTRRGRPGALRPGEVRPGATVTAGGDRSAARSARARRRDVHAHAARGRGRSRRVGRTSLSESAKASPLTTASNARFQSAGRPGRRVPLTGRPATDRGVELRGVGLRVLVAHLGREPVVLPDDFLEEEEAQPPRNQAKLQSTRKASSAQQVRELRRRERRLKTRLSVRRGAGSGRESSPSASSSEPPTRSGPRGERAAGLARPAPGGRVVGRARRGTRARRRAGAGPRRRRAKMRPSVRREVRRSPGTCGGAVRAGPDAPGNVPSGRAAERSAEPANLTLSAPEPAGPAPVVRRPAECLAYRGV